MRFPHTNPNVSASSARGDKRWTAAYQWCREEACNGVRCGLILRYIGAYCELYRCSALGLGMGDRTAWLKCQQCSKSNVITFPRFCSLHICKLTPATCKVRTIGCSCGFIPSLPLFMGLTVPGVLCERRRKAYCSFLLFFKQKKNKRREILALPPFEFLTAHFVRLAYFVP